MFGLIKKIFIVLLTGLVNGSNHTKYVSLSNQKCNIQPTLINLHPNEHSQQFTTIRLQLDRCVGSFNTLSDLSNKDLSNLINKHVSCECKSKFDGTKFNSNQWWNNDINVDVSVKNIVYVKKIMFGILLHVVVKMENI